MTEPKGTLAVVGKAPPRSKRKLPSAPDVDEDRLTAAEDQIGGKQNAPAPTAAPSTKTKTRRRKKKQREEGVLYIRGPKAVVEAFEKFKDDEELKANWDALLELMERAGVEVGDFDL